MQHEQAQLGRGDFVRASELLEELCGWLAPAKVAVRYPGVWLGEGIFAMHGHYGDRHVLGALAWWGGDEPPEQLSVSDYERALVFQFRGYIASQSDDYTAAIKHFEVALENGGCTYQIGDATGWLCPMLYKYFGEAPEKIYFKVGPL